MDFSTVSGPNFGFLCATSVELCVSVVVFSINFIHHRDTEFHRGCTEKNLRFRHRPTVILLIL